MLEAAQFSENDEVELIPAAEGLLLKKSQTKKQHKPLQQRLEEFYGKNIEQIIQEHSNDYKPEEIDWGKPVGNEVW